jgi:hypothetical protein
LIVHTATPVTVSAFIANPSVITNSVNLLQLNSIGSPTILGTFADQGGGHFTIVLPLTEQVAGQVTLQVSAAIRGQLKRVLSSLINIAVVDPGGYSLIDMTAAGQVIALGTVSTSEPTTGPNNTVSTLTNITPVDVFKGTVTGTTLVVSTPGGTINNIASEFLGTPHFVAGETVLVVLDGPDLSGHYTVDSDALGVFHIVTNPSGSQPAIVDSAYAEIEDVRQQTNSLQHFLARSAEGKTTLTEVLANLGVSR